MASKSAIITAIATNFVGITGLRTVYAPKAGTGVKQIPDDISPSLPACVLLANDAPIIPGSWERQTWNLQGTIWTRESPRGERYEELIDIGDAILLAIQQPNVTGVDPAVQSVLLTEFGQIVSSQWQRGDNAGWFLVLPFTIEAKVNRVATYGPA